MNTPNTVGDPVPRPRPSAAVRAVLARGDRLLNDGAVVRVFAPRSRAGYAPGTIASMVNEALDASVHLGDVPQLVVLPAGIGALELVVLPGEWWMEADHGVVLAAVTTWVEDFTATLPADHPAIVLGLDGAVQFTGRGRCPEAVQLAVTVVRRSCVHVTWKSKPTNAYEASVLEIAWDDAAWRPTPDALARHKHLGWVGSTTALHLVCHDAVAFAQRSRRAAGETTWAGVIRDQFDVLVQREPRPRFALNLLHELPRRPDAPRALSPIFQAAHKALQHQWGIDVVAVSGTNPACSLRAFEQLHEVLACAYRHVDVLFEPTAQGAA